MSKKASYQVRYLITTDCEDSDCSGKAVLTDEDGTILFDTKEDAVHFIDHLGISAKAEAA